MVKFLKNQGNIAVSPIIGTILAVAITIGVAVPVYMYMNSHPDSNPPTTVIVDLKYNSPEIEISHSGGGIVLDALVDNSGTLNFNNIYVKVNNEIPSLSDITITGDIDFRASNVITIVFNSNIPTTGDTIRVVYAPRNQLIEKLDL